VSQGASALDIALARVTNTSLAHINVTAEAAANGIQANASAYAAGIFQDAGAATSGFQDPIVVARASAIVNNAGLISVNANATAEGADAWARAAGIAIDQVVDIDNIGQTGSSSVALASVVNTLTIEFAGSASAGGGAIASAFAYGTGIDQDVEGGGQSGSTARARVDNSGSITVANSAKAEADVLGFAQAGGTAIEQEVDDAEFLFAEVFNSDEITITNSASAVGYRATASAGAIGIEQDVNGFGITSQAAVLTVDNGGTITVEAIAIAEVNATVLDMTSAAEADAYATGINQDADGVGNQTTTDFNPTGSIRETVNNEGELNVHASASASGGNGNFADAGAFGVLQAANGEAQEFALTVLNGGTIDVAATAVADGDGDGEANAYATGIGQFASGNYGGDGNYDGTLGTVAQVVVLSVDNTGDILVKASASAVGDGEVIAEANAIGIRQEFGGFGDSLGTTPADYAYHDITAIVNNVGHVDVSAVAVADGGDTNVASAYAVGINVEGGGYSVLNLDLFNSGTSIKVFASASADGGDAAAYAAGISVFGGQIENKTPTTKRTLSASSTRA
jgi:hypothetical protein